MRISDWSSDVCSSDLPDGALLRFHLLTGAQRIEQHARATVSDLAEDLLILRDGKGRRSEPRRHPVPLLPEALAELERMNGGCGPFAFSVTGGESGDRKSTRLNSSH